MHPCGRYLVGINLHHRRIVLLNLLLKDRPSTAVKFWTGRFHMQLARSLSSRAADFQLGVRKPRFHSLSPIPTQEEAACGQHQGIATTTPTAMPAMVPPERPGDGESNAVGPGRPEVGPGRESAAVADAGSRDLGARRAESEEAHRI